VFAPGSSDRSRILASERPDSYHRWAGENLKQLPELADDPVRHKVDVIIASTPGVLAAQRVTNAADRWAVYETIDGKTRVSRASVTDGAPEAIKNTEGDCSAMLQLARWSHADDVARANRARTARGLQPIETWAKYECRPYR